MLIKNKNKNKEYLLLNKQRQKNYLKAKQNNLCPTCEHKKNGNIYSDSEETLIFEDELFEVRFEQRPRRQGHTIIIVKPHYEDISEMPIELSHKFMALTKALINALKEVLKPVKVYLVTMCDGGRNHLHFQLIPRYEGEKHGKFVFVSKRKFFNYDEQMVKKIINITKRELKKFNY